MFALVAIAGVSIPVPCHEVMFLQLIQMLSTWMFLFARDSNELQRLDLEMGHQDSSSNNDHQDYAPNSEYAKGDTLGPVFCLLLGVSSDYAQPITGQVTEVTCPVIGWGQPELTPSKRQKMGPRLGRDTDNHSKMHLLQLKFVI